MSLPYRTRRCGPRLVAALVAILGLALVVDATPTQGPAQAGSPRPDPAGIGDPYWPLDGNRGIDVLHYDIADSYDFDDSRLSGVTTLTVRATARLDRFHLDLLLPASAVRIDGIEAGYERGGGGHELVITPDDPITRGTQFQVEVTYAGRPGRVAYAGGAAWLANADEVVTMGEPHIASWWFPANDHPLDKATYDITVTGPASHHVVSNGQLVQRIVTRSQATTHWRSVEPMASYLAFFALGRYQVDRGVHQGRPWFVAASRELAPATRAAAMRSLRSSPVVTAWLERRLGRYPFSSTGGLATSLPAGFALENQTRPTYPGRVLAGNRSILVHELAHQWFGDSVSVRHWRDIWLNEGFASFMEAAYAEAHGGPSAARWLTRTYNDARSYYGRSFWQLDLTHPRRGHIFDDAVYVRGAMTLQALRNRIGEHDFWQLLRTWLRSRRYQHGSVPQFEALAAEVSGHRLDAFFQAWLRAPRPPRDTRANGLGAGLRASRGPGARG